MINNNNNNKSNLKCIQINLRHSISATLNLIKIMNDLDIDIALIQEPYASHNIFNNSQIHLPYFLDTYTVHHSLNINHAYGAVIVIKKEHSAETISSPSSNHCVGVNLSKYNYISMFSIYCRPTQSLDSILQPLEAHKNNNNTILCLDSNSKNKMWNSCTTDKKGIDLEQFIENKILNVINKPKHKLAFIPKRTSMIDVTVAGDRPKIRSWKYLKEDSLSDHPYIYFEIEMERTEKVMNGPMVPRFNNIDKEKYIKNLELSLKKIEINWSRIKTSEEVDEIVDTITNTIATSAIKSKLPRKLLSKNKLDFWCEERGFLKYKR